MYSVQTVDDDCNYSLSKVKGCNVVVFCHIGQETYRIVSFLIGQFVDCATPGIDKIG